MWGMDFAGVCSCIQTFFFSPAEISSDRQSRLFQISTRLPNRHFENVVAAFTVKHGKSSDTERTTVKNRLGTAFANVTITWKNSLSTISIERNSGSLDTMSVDYFHNDILVSVDAAVQVVAKKGADKL
jgi:hypothetical protein